jgi:hypothetical protein
MAMAYRAGAEIVNVEFPHSVADRRTSTVVEGVEEALTISARTDISDEVSILQLRKLR